MNDLSFSRRQALAALSAGVAAVALPGCARTLVARACARRAKPTSPRCSIRSARICSLYRPKARPAFGIDTGARAVASLPARATAVRPGQERIAATLRADLARAEAVDIAAPDPLDPHQRRGRPPRLSHRARRLRPALWRRRRRRLAQHALCRDPECRRLSRRAALPRHRHPVEECRRRRGLSRAARQLCRPSSTASSAG